MLIDSRPSNHHLNKRPMGGSSRLIIVGALVALTISSFWTPIGCQVTDGDDQFQAYHGDIGRISASSSPVAPETVVRQPQLVTSEPQLVAPVAPPTLPLRAAQVLDRSRSRHQQAPLPVAVPKRNRITLAVRRDPEPSTLLEPTLNEPAPSQLVAPPAHSHHNHLQQHTHHLHQPQPVAVAPAQFQPPLVDSVVQSPAHLPAKLSSVTQRHSALIAQVAAERQADAINHQHQGSLGSPLEALSSPAVAQVQPPQFLAQQPPVAAASPALSFVNQPEEPIPAPSFEQVLSRGCPHKGVFSYENKDHCDRYYMCTNGTFTEEACPNGLAYSQMGAVYQHCAYNWNVDCGNKKTAEPLASPGCPWQFGIFPIVSAGRCSIDYFACEWGVPETKRCSPEGLFYDDRIKGCQWADQLGCKSEALLNFKCPPEDEDNPYWPYPRYYHTNRDIIVCVNEQPRLVHCNEDQLVDSGSLACIDLKKKKKKF